MNVTRQQQAELIVLMRAPDDGLAGDHRFTLFS
jgi:hypothetical protein